MFVRRLVRVGSLLAIALVVSNLNRGNVQIAHGTNRVLRPVDL